MDEEAGVFDNLGGSRIVKILTALLSVMVIQLVTGTATAGSDNIGLAYDEGVYDFGCVAEGYDFFHEFVIFNKGNDTVHIDDIDVNCDCSSVTYEDTLLAPGDTLRVRLRFNTSDYYGYVNKTMKVISDDHFMPQMLMFYKATVGQWSYAVNPRPTSLLFLPGQKSKTVIFPNPKLESVEYLITESDTDTFTASAHSSKVGKGEAIELEITPKDNLPKGTYQDNFRVSFDVPESDKPLMISIPIKIVRY